MKKLSPKEIQNIAELLHSPDSKNISLALNLLEHHQYVIPELIKPIEVFFIFNSKEKALMEWLSTAVPNYSWEESPVYILYLANTVLELLDEHYPALKRFIAQGSDYETWIVKENRRASIYSTLARKLSTNLSENGLAATYHRLTLKYLPNEVRTYLTLADLLTFNPPQNSTVEDYKDEIISYYDKAFGLKEDGTILYSVAIFYQKHLKDQALAELAWKRCLDFFPRYADAIVAYAEFQIDQKNWKRAKELAEQGWELQKNISYKNTDEVLYALGIIAWKGFKNYDAAEQYFEKSLEKNKYHFKPLESLCELFLEIKDYTKAIKWHKLALEQQPLDILLMEELAYLYLTMSDEEEARSYFEEILEIAPNYPPAIEALDLLKKV